MSPTDAKADTPQPGPGGLSSARSRRSRLTVMGGNLFLWKHQEACRVAVKDVGFLLERQKLRGLYRFHGDVDCFWPLHRIATEHDPV